MIPRRLVSFKNMKTGYWAQKNATLKTSELEIFFEKMTLVEEASCSYQDQLRQIFISNEKNISFHQETKEYDCLLFFF